MIYLFTMNFIIRNLLESRRMVVCHDTERWKWRMGKQYAVNLLGVLMKGGVIIR